MLFKKVRATVKTNPIRIGGDEQQLLLQPEPTLSPISSMGVQINRALRKKRHSEEMEKITDELSSFCMLPGGTDVDSSTMDYKLQRFDESGS
jgi:hypothetical protein